MAKEVSNERMVLVFILEREGGTGPVEVTGRADYTVTSDDLEVNRSMGLSLSTGQKTAIQNFAIDVLSDIRSAEGV